MYDRILVAIDADYEFSLHRTQQLGQMTGATVHLLHVARTHVMPGDILGGSRELGMSSEDDVDARERDILQQAVDKLSAAGIPVHGELVNATDHDIADVIIQRAEELKVHLIVLGHQHHRGPGNAFKASVAEKVIRHHPPCSILLAKPPDPAGDES